MQLRVITLSLLLSAAAGLALPGPNDNQDGNQPKEEQKLNAVTSCACGEERKVHDGDNCTPEQDDSNGGVPAFDPDSAGEKDEVVREADSQRTDQLIEDQPQMIVDCNEGVALKEGDQVVVIVGDYKNKVGVVVGKGPDKYCDVKFDNGYTIPLNSEEDFIKLEDCAICINPMTNPVAEFKCMEKEGNKVPHCFCKKCVDGHMSRTVNAVCPVCRQPHMKASNRPPIDLVDRRRVNNGIPRAREQRGGLLEQGGRILWYITMPIYVIFAAQMVAALMVLEGLGMRQVVNIFERNPVVGAGAVVLFNGVVFSGLSRFLGSFLQTAAIAVVWFVLVFSIMFWCLIRAFR